MTGAAAGPFVIRHSSFVIRQVFHARPGENREGRFLRPTLPQH